MSLPSGERPFGLRACASDRCRCACGTRACTRFSLLSLDVWGTYLHVLWTVVIERLPPSRSLQDINTVDLKYALVQPPPLYPRPPPPSPLQQQLPGVFCASECPQKRLKRHSQPPP